LIFFAFFSGKLEKNPGASLDDIWKEQMEKCMQNLPLQREEKNILRNLPEYLGTMDEKQQAADIGQSLDLIAAHIGQAEAEYGNRSRVIMSISVMAGIFIVILLL